MPGEELLKVYAPKIYNGSRRGMVQVKELIVQNILARTPKWRGRLKSQLRTRVHPSGIAWEIYFPDDNVVAHIMEGDPAASWKKQPSSDKLMPWVSSKLGISSSPQRIKRGMRRGRFKASKARIVAFLIGRKMVEQGIRIPLKFSGLGAMIRRTRELIQALQHIVARQFIRGYKGGV